MYLYSNVCLLEALYHHALFITNYITTNSTNSIVININDMMEYIDVVNNACICTLVTLSIALKTQLKTFESIMLPTLIFSKNCSLVMLRMPDPVSTSLVFKAFGEFPANSSHLFETIFSYALYLFTNTTGTLFCFKYSVTALGTCYVVPNNDLLFVEEGSSQVGPSPGSISTDTYTCTAKAHS